MPTPIRILRALVLLGMGAFALAAGSAWAAIERQADGVVIPLTDGTLLKLEVRSPTVIRVLRAKDRTFFAHASLVVTEPREAVPPWDLTQDAGQAELATAALRVHIDLATGTIAFRDRQGVLILAEQRAGTELQPIQVQGLATYEVAQRWEPNPGEALYGLGQHQFGFVNLKGHSLDLWQHNTEVALPLLVSSRGYGLLWDNPAYTRFGDRRAPRAIPADQLTDADGRPGGLTVSYFAGEDFTRPIVRRDTASVAIRLASREALNRRPIPPDFPAGARSVRWEGTVQATDAGEYTFDARFIYGFRLWLDDRLAMDHWRQDWLPGDEQAQIHLEAGQRVRLRAEWFKSGRGGDVALKWLTPSPEAPSTSLWSQAGGGLDYYFIAGPRIDQVIAGYRRLTGTAPLMPIWAFGLWQSRQRYKTQAEILDTLAEFRRRAIPIDDIVLDWFYWPENAWGSHQFDPARFPDPAGMIRAVHDAYHAHFMISVWPKFYTGTANFAELQAKGLLYAPNLREGIRDWVGYPDTFYDAFNPEGRRVFWSQIDRALFRLGVDAWWLDASEPDLLPQPSLAGTLTHMNPTALGPASQVLNAYPLMNSTAVAEGQRTAAPDQRVFILTRSAFGGQQRNAAATWSGDTSSTWTALRKQVPAALGFSISGIPYWTMDIGGFAVPPRFSDPHASAATVAEWRELNTRWFEFGTFVPLLRVHGEMPFREMWQFGGETDPAYRAQLKFDRLRYRLLPYIYSLAGAVTREDGTILRPLVMDFPDDPRVLDIADQYLFGPALLVSPVTAFRERRRPVYLPDGTAWYDFWTGTVQAGGRSIEAAAPFDEIPIHVRAGAIVPFGPPLQYTLEKPADPLTVYVYAGADGAFTVYEDDGLTNGYTRGAYSLIPVTWNDARHVLTLGARTGSFAGMRAERTMRIVRVAPDHPSGYPFDGPADREVRYTGQAVAVTLP